VFTHEEPPSKVTAKPCGTAKTHAFSDMQAACKPGMLYEFNGSGCLKGRAIGCQ
jgi:hypothetical protein